MSSVEAALRARAALRAVGVSASSLSNGASAGASGQNPSSDVFASLFDSARLNLGRKSETSFDRSNDISNSMHADRSDSSLDTGKKSLQTKPSDSNNSATQRTASQKTNRSKNGEKERKRDAAQTDDQKVSSRDGSHSASAQNPSDSAARTEADSPETVNGSSGGSEGSDPSPSTVQQLPGSGLPGSPIHVAVNPSQICGQANGSSLSSGSACAETTNSISGSGETHAGSNPQTLTSSALTPALKSLTGTQSAEECDGERQNTALNAENQSAGAKPASAGGSFDHVLQTAARTKAQLAGKTPSLNQVDQSGEVVKPDETAGMEKLARVIRSSGRDGQNKILIQLDPPELGKMQIDVRMKDQSLTVRMEAQTQAGHDALKSHLTDLKSALEQQGVHVQQMEVEIRPPHVMSGQEQPQGQQQPSHGNAGHFGHPQQQGNAGRNGGQDSSGFGATSGSVEGGQDTEFSAYSRGLNLVA